MDSNTYSMPPAERSDHSNGLRPPESPAPLGPLERSNRLAGLPAAVGELAAEDLDHLTDSALAEEIRELRRWMDGLEGQWLRRLAAADARGAAGADQGQPVASTASWLRRRLRLGAGTARDTVRTARALFSGP
jgi:hypothetical protein